MQGNVKRCHPGLGPAHWPGSPSAGIRIGRQGDSRSGGMKKRVELATNDEKILR
mgnify:CR=1 FL=1